MPARRSPKPSEPKSEREKEQEVVSIVTPTEQNHDEHREGVVTSKGARYPTLKASLPVALRYDAGNAL